LHVLLPNGQPLPVGAPVGGEEPDTQPELSYDIMMRATADTDPTEVGEISLKDRAVRTLPVDLAAESNSASSDGGGGGGAEEEDGEGGDGEGGGGSGKPEKRRSAGGGDAYRRILGDGPGDWAAAFLSLTTLDLTGTACHLDAVVRLPFPSLRVLTMACAGIEGHVNLPREPSPVMTTLLALDLSFNALAPESVAEIGQIQTLRVLNVSGNGFETLPEVGGGETLKIENS
jgi:hypothetical protein